MIGQVSAMNLKGLREQHHETLGQFEAIVNTATAAKRELTKAEVANADQLNDKLESLGVQIKLAEEQERQLMAIAGQRASAAGLGRETESARVVRRSHSNLKAFDNPEDAYAFGKFFQGSVMGDPEAANWCQSQGIFAAQTTTNNPKGGHVVPERLAPALIRLIEERGIFRRNSLNWPMSGQSESIPRRAGGLTPYFVAEAATITASDMTFDQIKLEAKKIAALAAVTSELTEENIITVADMLAMEMAYAFADKEDECGFNGDGTSTYGGIQGLKSVLAAGSIQDAATGNNSFGTLDLLDFENCCGKLAQYPGVSPKWYIHSAGYWASMARLMNAAGGNTTENFGNGPMRSFLGFPVEFVQVLPSSTGTLSETIVAYFGDLRMGTTLGTRRDFRVDVDSSVYFTSDMLAVRATERFDIHVHDRGTADAAGCIVALKTAT